MRILLSAYACSPTGGSEEAVGWQWALACARRGHEVIVLTPPGAAEVIARTPRPRSLHFVHVPEPRGMGLVPGQLHWYVRYLRWQRAARRVASRLLTSRDVDVVHHLTWASLQLGTQLGDLGVPMVFGPAGGGQTAPPSLRPYHRGRWATEALRTLVTTRLIRVDPFAVRTMRQTTAAIADNDETAALMRRLGAREVHQLSQCGIQADDLRPPDRGRRLEPSFTLLWVGRMLPRKGVRLALEAMRRVSPEVDVRLRIVGYGTQEEEVPRWIEEMGLEGRVELVGRVAHEDMVATYRTADALLFTSLRDSGGIQLVEAMAQGLPCIVLRHQGAALLVDATAGLQVPVSTADGTADGVAAAITRLAGDRELWWTLAQGAHQRAQAHTWDSLVAAVEPILDVAASRRDRHLG